ncbi:MAG: TIGR03767 family metallophosphoesterase, partial [Mycobacteriaceae bacterium]
MSDDERNRISRRGFLGATGALGTLWVVGTASPAQALDRAVKGTTARAMSTAGTTLEQVAARVNPTGYTRLEAGLPWTLVVRPDITKGISTRDDSRTALACFVQFTDVHVVDSESPVRFEYVHPFTGSAYRPHEVLSNQGTASLVRRVNSLIRRKKGGPFTGRPFDCLVSTGDNTDNKEHIELDWFFAAYNGGSVTPSTGDLSRYEGVQNSGVPLYWNPESSMHDLYKEHGFPQIRGLLTAALQPFTSPGLKLPWYSVFGNHDDSVEGTLPSGIPFFEDAYTGTLKIMGASSEGAARNLVNALQNEPQAAASMVTEAAGIVRTVTADARRHPFTPQEYIAAHLDHANDGPGPHGHGFADGSEISGIAYYTFPLGDGVVGITMDSTNRIGLVNGSLGDAQFRWIEQTLVNGSSRYFDSTGTETRHSVSGDTYFVLFSHHTSDTMGNLLPDPANPWEPRHSGPELVALLQRFPNVLAWVNGHTHVNDINP